VAPSSNDVIAYMSIRRFEGSFRRSYHAATTVPSGATRTMGKNWSVGWLPRMAGALHVAPASVERD
jgi:hypothetical protein